MQIVNMKNWYSTEQTMDLLGVKYRSQLIRWRKSNEIPYVRLCSRTFYLRLAVNNWLKERPSMYKHKATTVEGETQVLRVIDYEALVNLKKRIVNQKAYDIPLNTWKPYCLLENNPETMYLWRIVTSQVVLPQVRTLRAYNMIFYNVEDIIREFSDRRDEDESE